MCGHHGSAPLLRGRGAQRGERMSTNPGSVLLRGPARGDGVKGTAAAAAARQEIRPTTRSGSPRITVLVPAYNESDQILATLEGLRDQTLPPARTIVVADNCSDDTVTLALAAGAEVFETVGNGAKKAGALNQAWSYRFRRVTSGDRRGPERRRELREAQALRRTGERRVAPSGRPDADDEDLVLVQDADSKLDRGFLEGAARHVLSNDRMGAVGGTFRGDAGGGLVGHLQRNEY